MTSSTKTETTNELLNKRREIEKRVPIRDIDLAEISAINRKLGVPS